MTISEGVQHLFVPVSGWWPRDDVPLYEQYYTVLDDLNTGQIDFKQFVERRGKLISEDYGRSGLKLTSVVWPK